VAWRRNPEALQPEVCEVTGRLVPADELVVSEVDGLQGAAVGRTAPWLARARTSPSSQDLRNEGFPPYETPELLEGGGRLWQYGEGAAAYSPETTGLFGWYKPQTSAGLVGSTWTDESGNGNHLDGFLDPTSGDEITGTGRYGWITSTIRGFRTDAPSNPLSASQPHVHFMVLGRAPDGEATSEVSDHIVDSRRGGSVAAEMFNCFRRGLKPEATAGSQLHHDDAVGSGVGVYECHLDYRTHRRSVEVVGNGRVLLRGDRVLPPGSPAADYGFEVGLYRTSSSATGTLYALLVWARTEAEGPLPEADKAAAREYLNSLRQNWPD
jgi:hypothetical protein